VIRYEMIARTDLEESVYVPPCRSLALLHACHLGVVGVDMTVGFLLKDYFLVLGGTILDSACL
jgi:hypothetical protein